jgi:hypothetical protein
MSKQRNLTGATLAIAAALAFTSAPITSFADPTTDTGMQCTGANTCKGQTACKTANNDCKGKNSCKGQGFVMEQSTGDCNGEGGTTWRQ